MASKAPARIEVTINGETFAPGDEVPFSVVVTARDRLANVDLLAEMLGLEEVDAMGEGDEDLFDEDEGDDMADQGTVNVSYNGEGVEGGDEDEEMDEEGGLISSTTYSDEATLASKLSLRSGESRTFNGSFTLPEDAQPTYDGINATHSWWIDIYLDGDVEVSQSVEFFVR